MDGLLGNIIEKVVEKASGSGGGGYSSYEQQPSYGGQGYGQPAPPQDLPYPWVARWDERDQRWFYVNEQTGERSWERPYGGVSAYGERSYGQPQSSYGYEGGYEGGYEQPRPEHKDHSMMYGAAGAAAAAAGLVGEVEAIPDEIENKWDNAVDDVEDFPEDAAEWTGRRVGEVEQFGDNMDDAYYEGRAEGRDDW
ncbi:hypothetical protein CNMCM5793_001394 [Aspergillus hiratsukae]|uniref:WW domain-containing protein n=1 Tax=Aspergillus hiratsukae TaxID=1194566 RepID=A0A8H6Q6A1_9EURO|nr:hypothetical protein CNMCM5793_001394 [Aspergillus hiratsukae]KAF7167123.1 hypothetical protein CNMCM6106_002808 [Aspergillus hiratsukae]